MWVMGLLSVYVYYHHAKLSKKKVLGRRNILKVLSTLPHTSIVFQCYNFVYLKRLINIKIIITYIWFCAGLILHWGSCLILSHSFKINLVKSLFSSNHWYKSDLRDLNEILFYVFQFNYLLFFSLSLNMK